MLFFPTFHEWRKESVISTTKIHVSLSAGSAGLRSTKYFFTIMSGGIRAKHVSCLVCFLLDRKKTSTYVEQQHCLECLSKEKRIKQDILLITPTPFLDDHTIHITMPPWRVRSPDDTNTHEATVISRTRKQNTPFSLSRLSVSVRVYLAHLQSTHTTVGAHPCFLRLLD